MSTHPIPAVVDALVAAVRAAPAFSEVHVDDGPPVTGHEQHDAIAIGFDITELTPAASNVRQGFGGRRDESYGLSCLIDSSSGDPSALAAHRRRAYELLDAVGDLLAENPNLNGTCNWARVTRHSYRPGQAEDGAGALIEFGVQVDATRFQGE